MSDIELCYMPAAEALRLFKAKKLSPVELMEATIRRAEATKKKINALTFTHFDEAMALARRLADGPTFAHGVTKAQLHLEWNMSLDQAIESEAQAQAICMQTNDFSRAYHAFANKQMPKFEGD